MSRLLVIAGEASGDELAGAVVRRLGVPAVGVGGPALAAAGARVRDAGAAAMGLVDPVRRAVALGCALAGAARDALAADARAALLVGLSEPNERIGAWLRRRGVRVLWYAPPQIWAWRPGRARGVRRAADRLAVVLPFEQALWRSHGADAFYVGHVASTRRVPRREARAALHLPGTATAVALLPGSRAGEVRRLTAPLLAAAARLEAAGVVARVLVAPGLSPSDRRALCAAAAAAGVGHSVGLEHVTAFDAAIACSGTATLECAAAGVPPVVVYRTDPITAFVARRAVTTPFVALPNVLLGRRAFPELLLRAAEPGAIAAETLALLSDVGPARDACREVAQRLASGAPAEGAPDAVARLLRPWLA